jgi:hypothetical protein
MRRAAPWIATALVAAIVALGWRAWRARSFSDARAAHGAERGAADETEVSAVGGSTRGGSAHAASSAVSGGAPAHGAEAGEDGVAFDRKVRDTMRGQIWQALGEPPPDAAPPKSPAPYVLLDAPPPDPPGEGGGGIEPKYIQEHVRSQFFGPALDCYTRAQEQGRLPKPHGTVVFYFTIVGDEKVGGIVESVDVLNESTLRDPEMIDCMRQSFLSVTFPPPKGGGWVTVKYPIELSPDDADE